MDDALKRLLRAASSGTAPELGEPSLPHKQRVMAAWRARRSSPAWYECLDLLRRGLVLAGAGAVVLALVSVSQIRPVSPGAWDYVDAVANLSYKP